MSDFKSSFELLAKQRLKEGSQIDEIRADLYKFGHRELIDEILDSLNKKKSEIEEKKTPLIMSEPQESWYTGPDENSIFWNSFKQILLKKKWDVKSIESVDNSSTDIIASTKPPLQASYSSKGLVLGYVQSGKTTNYTAVISKVLDLGYQFIIVLAGLTNALRKQTQDRLDKELVDPDPNNWIQLTNINRDFSNIISGIKLTAILKQKSNIKFLAVVKKNPFILSNLIRWIDNQDVREFDSVLIIDDEADNASVNTSKKEDHSKINRLIIELVEKFKKKTYIAYTATPFANILIDSTDKNDLYPQDFIKSLEKPDQYFGTEDIFGRMKLTAEENDSISEGLNIVNIVPIEEIADLVPNKNESFSIDLTDSLESAIIYFICASAAKKFREDNDSITTMLIHVTRLADYQIDLGYIVENKIDNLKNRYKSENNILMNEFEYVWIEQTKMIQKGTFNLQTPNFSELQPYINDILTNVKILVQNYKTVDDILYEYENSKICYPYIVIGGNTLSRGLTLEGLIVSYFVRVAYNYDTLLQMGRWFGFYKDYADLVRLWMTQEIYEFFQHLATVEEELRQDINFYQTSPEITPLSFAPRIRTHGILKVTSPNKMRFAVPTDKSYSGRKIETKYFDPSDTHSLKTNLNHTKEFLIKLNTKFCSAKDKNGNQYIFFHIPVDYIIEYIKNYQFHEGNRRFNTKSILKYINKHEQMHLSWNIVIFSNPKANLEEIDIGLPSKIHPINRFYSMKKEQYIYYKGLISKSDLIIDIKENNQYLNLSDVAKVFDKKVINLQQSEMFLFRETRIKNPVLFIYPISKDSVPDKKDNDKDIQLNSTEHIIGIGIYFPQLDFKIPLSYVTANIKQE